MAIELCEEKINIYKPLNGFIVKAIVDSDVIVPDVKPDVLRILQANAVASVNEKFVQKNMITVSGFVDYTVLYLSENEDKINTIRTKCPFTHRIEIEGTDEDCMNYVLCDISHVEFGVNNSRKINLKSVICFETDVVGKSTFNAVSSISSSVNIPYKSKNIKLLNMSVCKSDNFIVSDEISLSSLEKEIEIIKIDQKICANEIKCMNDKIVIKGELNAEILYLEDGVITHLNGDIPFTEVFDAEGLTPQMHTMVKCNLTSFDYDVILSENGTVLSYNGTVEVAIKGFDEVSFNLITDAYSPDYELNVSKNEIECVEVKDSIKKSFSMNETVSAESTYDIEKIYNFSSKAHVDSISCHEGFCIFNGYTDVKFLFSDTEDHERINALNTKIPFSFKVESPYINKNTRANYIINILHSGYVLKNGKEIEVRMVLEIETLFYDEVKHNVLSGINIDEDSKLNKKNQSGITIYYTDENEPLWDIAKRYNTTVDEILALNNLDEGTVLKKRQQLIITKRIIV